MQTILLNDNKNIRKYTGVEKFHNAGYYGERVTAATGEFFNIDTYNPDGLVKTPLGKRSGDEHAYNTAEAFFQVAPKSKLVQLSTESSVISGKVKTEFVEKSIPIIKEMKIYNMFVSLNRIRDSKIFELESNALKDIQDYFKIFYCAGNDADNKYNSILDVDETIGVGAYVLMNGITPNPAGYSSTTPSLDFSAPTCYTNRKATSPESDGYPRSGTSFSTPWLCGMACLVDDFFIHQTGKPLTREGMYQFMKDHTVDIGVKGFDSKCGWGAVVLPDPSEIDIKKYRAPKTIDTFNDRDKIPTWAIESIERVVNKGYMETTGNNNVSPNKTMTRAEFMVALDRYDMSKSH